MSKASSVKSVERNYIGLHFDLTSHCAVLEKKNPYPPHGRSSEIPRGRAILKAKILEAKYEAKLEFPGGGGCAKQKILPLGSIDIFWNCTLTNTFVLETADCVEAV